MLRAVIAPNLAFTGNVQSVILSADVNLSTTNVYFDGPSVNVGATGTWWVYGSVALSDVGAATFQGKLWDGNTVIQSGVARFQAGGVSGEFGGSITNPTGNVRISVRNITANTGAIKANLSTVGADSVIYAFQIR
jgi:hypothetical protein